MMETAEERLKELYDRKPRTVKLKCIGETMALKPPGLLIKPEHIDLIADLVVERLKKEGKW